MMMITKIESDETTYLTFVEKYNFTLPVKKNKLPQEFSDLILKRFTTVN